MRTFDDAQKWLVRTSLAASVTLIGFFLLAPQLNYPLDVSQARHIVQLVVPPFFGYLAAAARFVVMQPGAQAVPKGKLPPLMPLLLRGTMGLYVAILGIAILAFYLANSPAFSSHRQTSMTFDDLGWAVCAALSLQASTFALMTAFIFGQEATPVPIDSGADK